MIVCIEHNGSRISKDKLVAPKHGEDIIFSFELFHSDLITIYIGFRDVDGIKVTHYDCYWVEDTDPNTSMNFYDKKTHQIVEQAQRTMAIMIGAEDYGVQV